MLDYFLSFHSSPWLASLPARLAGKSVVAVGFSPVVLVVPQVLFLFLAFLRERRRGR
jgi:hypothetical protein